MLDFAQRLSEEQARAAELRLSIKHAEEDLQHNVLRYEQRILEEVGKDGLGSTAEDRKRKLAVLVYEHDGYKRKVEEIRTMQKTLSSIEAQVNALENERRAMEWMIRRDQVAAIMGSSTSDAAVDKVLSHG